MEKWLAIVSAACAATAYITGYSYLTGYYGFFDMNLSELGFSPQYVLAHSFAVYRGLLWDDAASIRWLLAMLVFGAIGIATWQLRDALLPPPQTGSWSSERRGAVAVVLVVAAAFLFYALIAAHGRGAVHAQRQLPALYPLQVEDPDGRSGVDAFLRWNPNYSLVHLVTTTTATYGVLNHKSGDRRWIARIPHSLGLSTRVFTDPPLQ